VRSATAAKIEAKRVRLTQAGFDRLIEQLAQQDLRNFWTIGQAVGVDFSSTQLPASPGWIDYFLNDNYNTIGATRVRYEKKFERESSNGDGLSEVAAEISLWFSDEDRLSCDTLWKKYGKEGYVFFPDRGICLFRINGVRIFMRYSGDTSELYVSEVTVTWEKSPSPERYPVISMPK
jgi:hypothetical protein